MFRNTFLLTCLLLLYSVQQVFAQFNYQSANAVVLSGVYTDLGSTGTAITTNFAGRPIEFDDTVSSVRPIGFNFVFNGSTFNSFVLSTNGFIKLGNTAPGAFTYDFLNSTETNIIAPFNIDLQGGAAPEYRVLTSGVSPNRICTIQFKDLRDVEGLSNQYLSMNFQIKLYETTNNIDFVYGNFIATADPFTIIPVNVGIKGTATTNSVNATKPSTASSLNASFLDGAYINNKFNLRNTLLPVSGTILRFVAAPLLPNDLKLSYLYTLGDLPLNFGASHVVRTQVKNIGTQSMTNVPIFLQIKGADVFRDTQTLVSLVPGAVAEISFKPFTPQKKGMDSVQVMLGPDGNNNNNKLTSALLVGEGLFSYANSDSVFGRCGFGAGSGVLLVRHDMNGSGYVTAVRARISNDSNSIGKVIYAEMVNGGGTIIAQSARVQLKATDLNTYKLFELEKPVLINNGEFYVGIAQTLGSTSYSPIAYQFEGVPARTGAFYSTMEGGGPLVQSNTTGRFMIQAVINSQPVFTLPQIEICANGGALAVEGTQGVNYQWQMDKNNGSGFVNINDSLYFTGTRNDTLILSAIPSSWYGYKFVCVVDGVRRQPLELRIVNYWTGALSNNWDNVANWSCNRQPDANTDVIIAAGAPVLAVTRFCRSIYISPSASVTIRRNGKLNIAK